MDKKKPRASTRRPGGRTEMVRLSVATAVLYFIELGNFDFSYNELSERSGIHKTTLYRRWPARIDLLQEAVKQHNQNFTLPAGDTWDQAAACIIKNTASFFSNPVELAINKALLSNPSTESNAVYVEYWQPIQRAMNKLVAAAKERGELPRHFDTEVLLKTIISPLLVESLMTQGAIKQTYINDLIAIARSYANPSP